MTDTNKLAELIKKAKSKMWGKTFHSELERNMFVADYLLANGVFLLPEDLKGTEDFSISAFIEAMQMYKEKDQYIKPPCKVGNTVYMTTPNGNIRNLTILSIDIELEKEEIKMTCLAVYEFEGNPCYIQIQSFKFGKTVFLTKEEAEAKLRELKSNGT